MECMACHIFRFCLRCRRSFLKAFLVLRCWFDTSADATCTLAEITTNSNWITWNILPSAPVSGSFSFMRMRVHPIESLLRSIRLRAVGWLVDIEPFIVRHILGVRGLEWGVLWYRGGGLPCNVLLKGLFTALYLCVFLSLAIIHSCWAEFPFTFLFLFLLLFFFWIFRFLLGHMIAWYKARSFWEF